MQKRVNVSLNEDNLKKFEELKEVLKSIGLKITLSGIFDYALEQYIKILEPLKKKVVNKEKIDSLVVYDIVSHMFKEVSKEIGKINNENNKKE